MNPAAIVGWTGKGSLEGLRRSAENLMSARGSKKAQIMEAAGTLIGTGIEPTVAANALAELPGVSYVAVGYEFSNGIEECTELLSGLASRYMPRGASFKVVAELTNATAVAGDLVLASSSKILSMVHRSRVDDKKPRFTFRISMTGSRGACGLEIAQGVGGIPTAINKGAYCLVSGGRHSSVLAWMSALAGFSLRLVHVREEDESLRKTAMLYSELAHRIDPTHVSLHVLLGDESPSGILWSWLEKKAKTKRDDFPVFNGLHPECWNQSTRFIRDVSSLMLSPLMLIQEKDVLLLLQQLGLKDSKRRGRSILLGKRGDAGAPYVTKTFAGKKTDIHEVIDGIVA